MGVLDKDMDAEEQVGSDITAGHKEGAFHCPLLNCYKPSQVD